MDNIYDRVDHIGERIVKLLKEKNKTRRLLSDVTGISYASIGCYCRGVRMMDALNLALIADALEVSADYLLFGSEVEE